MKSILVKDLTNKRFGRLKVIEFEKTLYWRSYWKCLCDCGAICVKKGKDLSNGSTKSCGCLVKDTSSKNAQDMYKKSSSATRSRIYINNKPHPLYVVLKGMIQRCYNPNCSIYKWYGKKGITVYEKWIENPTRFVEWALQNGWEKGLVCDRLDPNKGYNPTNCQFVTQHENVLRSQTRANLKSSHIVWYMIDGNKMTQRDAAEYLMIDAHTLASYRKKYGKEKAIKILNNRNKKGKK